jgi:hypothetical protein
MRPPTLTALDREIALAVKRQLTKPSDAELTAVQEAAISGSNAVTASLGHLPPQDCLELLRFLSQHTAAIQTEVVKVDACYELLKSELDMFLTGKGVEDDKPGPGVELHSEILAILQEVKGLVSTTEHPRGAQDVIEDHKQAVTAIAQRAYVASLRLKGQMSALSLYKLAWGYFCLALPPWAERLVRTGAATTIAYETIGQLMLDLDLLADPW